MKRRSRVLAALRNRSRPRPRPSGGSIWQEACEFVREHPQHLLVSGANVQLADVLVERDG